MKIKEKIKLVVSLLFCSIIALILILPFLKAQIYLGVADGFVFYSNGSIASNALVNVFVINCSAPPQYCSGQTYSQDNGYYVIANLALEPYGYGLIKVSKGNWFIEEQGQADSYGILSLNLTLCEAPSMPILQAINNFHPPSKDYSIIFNWSSGIDPNGLPTYDMFYLDGTWQTANAPLTRINLPIGFHEWKVKTCNANCCSEEAYDNFTILNSVPTMPILLDQPNTNNNTVLLQWQNSSDADGDPISYDFMIDSELRENVTSPQLVEGLSFGLHEWKVRACDFWQCSNWAADTFSIQNLPCPKPNITAIADSCNSTISFEWQSVAFDSEGQLCHDEFMLNGVVIDNNATSPKGFSFNQTQLVEWAVRSCDEKGACSEWQSDSFIYCSCPTTQIGPSPTPSAARREAICEIKEAIAIKGYQLIILAQKSVYQGESFSIELEFVPFEDWESLVIEIENPNKSYFSLSQEKIEKEKMEKNVKISKVITINSSIKTKAQGYEFGILVRANNTLLAYKKIKIDVKEVPFIVKIIPTEKPTAYPYIYKEILYATLILSLIFIFIVIYKVVRAVKKAILRKKLRELGKYARQKLGEKFRRL
ncbi:MAG: hypothetical protein QW199_02000 [Candidatus Pacearchaeota archaeon]